MGKNIDFERAATLYDSGLVLEEVGDRLGATRMQVARLLRKNGHPIRRRAGLPVVGKHAPRKLCSCCGKRYVPTEPVGGVLLTKLCVECYKMGGDTAMETQYIPAITGRVSGGCL